MKSYRTFVDKMSIACGPATVVSIPDLKTSCPQILNHQLYISKKFFTDFDKIFWMDGPCDQKDIE